jgi:hypothetical protein
MKCPVCVEGGGASAVHPLGLPASPDIYVAPWWDSEGVYHEHQPYRGIRWECNEGHAGHLSGWPPCPAGCDNRAGVVTVTKGEDVHQLSTRYSVDGVALEGLPE